MFAYVFRMRGCLSRARPPPTLLLVLFKHSPSKILVLNHINPFIKDVRRFEEARPHFNVLLKPPPHASVAAGAVVCEEGAGVTGVAEYKVYMGRIWGV